MQRAVEGVAARLAIGGLQRNPQSPSLVLAKEADCRLRLGLGECLQTYCD